MKFSFINKVISFGVAFPFLVSLPIFNLSSIEIVFTNPERAIHKLSAPSLIQKSLNPFVVEPATGRVVERLSVTGKRVLREGSEEDIRTGIGEGRFKRTNRVELLSSLDRSYCGIGITGGGDCAGIADCLSSLRLHLNPRFQMLGVRNAGIGLSVPPEKFAEKLILLDRLLANDFAGQSSTPLGSARKDPLKGEESLRHTIANIKGHAFFYGTGGNDHLGLLERIARLFPDMVVVGTFKSIDGDGFIDGKPAQMLGFHSAVQDYREAIYAIAQSAQSHKQWTVVETFGREVGKLAFEAGRGYPPNFDSLPQEEQRKIVELRETVMILVPEKPASLQAIADRAKEIKKKEGSVTIVVAEGFMPPELKLEMKRLASNLDLKERWIKEKLLIEEIPELIEFVGEDDPRYSLRRLLQKDRAIAVQFADTVWKSKLDDHGNVAKLAGISSFIRQALSTLAGAQKVNLSIQNYEARGVSPSEYDQAMGRKVGKKMAELINKGVTGGKAVIYFEGMNAMTEDPEVVDLVGVTADNNLDNAGIYTEKMLRENGVFMGNLEVSL